MLKVKAIDDDSDYDTNRWLMYMMQNDDDDDDGGGFDISRLLANFGDIFLSMTNDVEFFMTKVIYDAHMKIAWW